MLTESKTEYNNETKTAARSKRRKNSEKRKDTQTPHTPLSFTMILGSRIYTTIGNIKMENYYFGPKYYLGTK